MPSAPRQPPKKKDERIEIRVDPELANRAREKAESRGWTLASVLRSLLELWVDEDVIDPKDVGRSSARAKKSKKPKSEGG